MTPLAEMSTEPTELDTSDTSALAMAAGGGGRNAKTSLPDRMRATLTKPPAEPLTTTSSPVWVAIDVTAVQWPYLSIRGTPASIVM
jgi:hypothetical protein